MLRWLVIFALAGALAYLGSTVKLGKLTFFGHVRAIWHTEQAQDLKQGVEDKARPAVRKLEKGVKAGYHAMEGEDGSDGSAAHRRHAHAHAGSGAGGAGGAAGGAAAPTSEAP